MAKIERVKNESQISFVKGKTSLVFSELGITFKGVSGCMCCKSEYNDFISYSDVLFYDWSARFFGLAGYKIKGGGQTQFEFKGLKKKDCLDISQWLINHGVPLSSKEVPQEQTYSHSGFHPLSEESITILDNALAHHRKTIFTNKDSIVPYNKIDFFIAEKSFCSCTNKLGVVGELSFTTNDNFSKDCINEVASALKAKSVELAKGKIYHPCIFSKVKNKKQSSLIVMDDKIVYMGYIYNSGSVVPVEKVIKIKLFRSISKYKCKPIFSLFNRTLIIEGKGSTDLRTNEVLEQDLVFPGVFFFWWFCCGRLKAACKRLYKK